MNFLPIFPSLETLSEPLISRENFWFIIDQTPLTFQCIKQDFWDWGHEIALNWSRYFLAVKTIFFFFFFFTLFFFKQQIYVLGKTQWSVESHTQVIKYWRFGLASYRSCHPDDLERLINQLSLIRKLHFVAFFPELLWLCVCEWVCVS